MTADGIPVIRKTAIAVSHGMGIFTHDQRTFVFRILDPFHQIVNLRIHRSHQVGGQSVEVFIGLPFPLMFRPQSSLVMKQAAIIPFTDPGGTSRMVGSVTRFISQRPENDRRVVLVLFYHPYGSIQKTLRPGGLTAKATVVVMGFDVCLVDHIKPVFITELIPKRVIRIV